MALDRENKALPYITGRAIAIVEHHAQSHFGPNTLATMFNTPEYSINVFMRYVPSDDSDWAEVAGTPFPKHLIPVEQSQAWVGYYHQKSELRKKGVRQNIGQRIAEIRKKRGITILQVHEMTGLDNSNIGKIEKGKYNVGIDILQRICDALFVKIEFKGIEFIMKVEERLTALADGETCFIQRKIEVNEDATMYHFICGGTEESACIVYNDGTLFHQWDWQGGRPESVEEIEDFKWLREDGVEAINFLGLPRVLE